MTVPEYGWLEMPAALVAVTAMMLEPIPSTIAVSNRPSLTGTTRGTPLTVTVTVAAVTSATEPEIIWTGLLVVLPVGGNNNTVIRGMEVSRVIYALMLLLLLSLLAVTRKLLSPCWVRETAS